MNNETKYLIRKTKLYFYSFRYSQYYQIFVPVLIISISLVLFISYILPVMNQWFSINNEIQTKQQLISTVRNNILTLQSINKNELDNNLDISLRALPAEKEFDGIINAISLSAASSQVTIEDYSFSLGKIIKEDKKKHGVIYPIQLDLKIGGDLDNIELFFKQIETKTPLAEVKKINFSNNITDMTLIFYTKSYPVLNIDDTKNVELLTQAEQNIISLIKSWVY